MSHENDKLANGSEVTDVSEAPEMTGGAAGVTKARQASAQPTKSFSVAQPTQDPSGTDSAGGQVPPTFTPPEPVAPKPESFSSERVMPPQTNPAIAATIVVATLAIVIAIAIPREPFLSGSNQPAEQTTQSSVSSQGQASPSSSGSSSNGTGSSSGTTGGTSNGGGSQSTQPQPTSGQQTQQNSQQDGSLNTNPSNGADATASQDATSTRKEGHAHAGQVGQGSQSGNSSGGGSQSSSSQSQSSSGSGGSSGQSGKTELVAQSNGADNDASREFEGVSSEIGNLVNGGQFAWHDKYIYYVKPEDGKEWVTRSIVRTQADGKKKDEVYKASSDTKSIGNINALGKRLVFTEIGKDKTYVVSVDSEGGDKRTIDECDDGSLCQVDDGWVYYQRGGVVYRCDPYGQGVSKVIEAGKNDWCVTESIVFTVEDDSTTLYMTFVKSGERMKVYDASAGCYIASTCFKDPNTLPILEKSKTGKQCSVVMVYPTGSPHTIWSGEGDMEGMCPTDDGVSLLRRNAANDYSIFAVREPDKNDPKTHTADWRSELKHVGDVKGKGEVRYLSYFPGNVTFASVNNNAKCGWNVVDLKGGEARSL